MAIKQTQETVYRASTTAPVNIAVIKYWGKRDSKLNLPTNSSLSVTLSQRDLRTHTTASCSSSFNGQDTLLLNSYPQDISNPRTQACLTSLRALRRELVEAKNSSVPKLSEYPLRIVSENNFPTAAGLASSAAGFAALVRAVADLYELPSSPEELSKIARQGSGSACRSLFGGYVAWEAGSATDGNDSLAVPLQSATHWPSMRALILVASDRKKDVSSTAGMQATVATSGLFSARVDKVVPERMQKMKKAIDEKNFETFGELAMRDSNSFHATCADTWPPIFYMNDTSRAAVRMVEAINQAMGKIVCAYTFDAGPNAVIFYEEENAQSVESAFQKVIGHVDGWKIDPLQEVASGSTTVPKQAKETPSWLSRFSEALTMDAPNAGEREPAPDATHPTMPPTTSEPSSTTQTKPKTPVQVPEWLRTAAENLTVEAPNTGREDSSNTSVTNTTPAASAPAQAKPKATPGWLNKFAEALTTDAPSMREAGEDEAAGASKPSSTTPAWLNRFAEALTADAPRTSREASVSAPSGTAEVENTPAAAADASEESKTTQFKQGEMEPAPATIASVEAHVEANVETQEKGQVDVDERVAAALREGVSRVIMTGVGEGPKITRDHLVDEQGRVENRYSF